MPGNPIQPLASIVIPAHNEATVIRRTLAPLAEAARAGRFEVVVVCNGCTDDTAAQARRALPPARVVETSVASKTQALNIGLSHAITSPLILLDADLTVLAEELCDLIRPLESGDALAAVGRMKVDLSYSSPWVRSFFRVWRLNPYFDHGKFGGLYALSRVGQARLGIFPDITADDEYARRLFRGDEVAVTGCRFVVQAPRTLADLIKIRRRSRRGTRALGGSDAVGRTALSMLRRIARHPDLWLHLPIYVAVTLYVRLAVAIAKPGSVPVWERDDSSRMLPTGRRP